MRNKIFKNSLIVMLGIMIFSGSSCKKDDEPKPQSETVASLSDQDKTALLFMLEEEKLARDIYEYLDGLWNVPQFANIKLSEQKHIDKVVALLNKYNIAYTMLPVGEYSRTELKDLHDKFINDGKTSKLAALNIGATIEDLDIVDLQENIDATNNSDLKSTFASLQCASGNHIRAFVTAIEAEGGTYQPQFLTQDDYNTIISSPHASCN